MPELKPITSHTASPVGVVVEADGTVYFLISEYYLRHGSESKRLVVETGENGEMVSETLHRALNDEVSETADSVEFFHLDNEKQPFFVKFKDDERKKGGTHAMSFFLGEFIGDLRKEKKNDGDEELGPIVRTEASKLIAQMFDYKRRRPTTVPVHLEAAVAALHALAQKNVEVYYRYSKILSEFPAPEAPSEDEMKLIRTYAKWF